MKEYQDSTNDSLFSHASNLRGKELGLNIVWNSKIKRELFKVLFNATRLIEISAAQEKLGDGGAKPKSRKSNAVPLADCFKEHN